MRTSHRQRVARTLLVGLLAGALSGALVGAVAGQSTAAEPGAREARDPVISRDVVFTLTNTNAASRPIGATDAANPRFYNDPKGTAAAAQRGNPNGHVVRFADDNADAAAMLAMLLETAGHQVTVEHDARDALARAPAARRPCGG